MTKQYQGKSGKIYEVFEKKIAGGGEGSIHEIQGDEGLVAKIFKDGRTSPEREAKLLLMMKKKLSADELFQVAWPQDVIYERSGFAGYIMPKIRETSSLTELYSDEEYNLNHRLIVAYNLAGAVDTVHQMGQVVGDFNPQNICVRLKGNDKFKVTLVDTDSYHITADGKTYRCEVGRGEYIAPELQKKLGGNVTLKTVSLPSYTKETDLFALAVHIFQLLMNGCHPFACAKETNLQQENISRMTGSAYADSVVAPQPVENIKTGFCAFYEKKLGFAAPPYAPVFESLPIQIREMFIQTFKEGYKNPSQRITALEWQKALRKYTEHIRECSKHHFYFDHAAKCPLCAAEERWKDVIKKVSGSQSNPIPEPQPSVSSGTGTASSSNLGKKSKTNPTTSGPQIVQKPKTNRWKLLGSVAYFVAVIALVLGIPELLARKYSKQNTPVSITDNGFSANNGEDSSSSANVVDDGKIGMDSERNTEKDYEQLLSDAFASINQKLYYNAEEYCDEAISLNVDVPSKKRAYYLKGQALYERAMNDDDPVDQEDDLDDALEALESGENEPEDSSVNLMQYDELKEKVQNEIETRKKRKKEAEKEARENEKKLKKMNKIISAIQKKKFKNAGTLALKYVDAHTNATNSTLKIYVKNGKIVDNIKSGKGFMLEGDDYVHFSLVYGVAFPKCVSVYYGKFKKGKKDGKGIETGVDVLGSYYAIQGEYKKDRLQGKASVYQWDQVIGGNKYQTKIVGKYKKDYENGKMKLVLYRKSGSVMNTYYFSSKNGKRKLLSHTQGMYVYGKTANGQNIIGCDKKAALSGHGHPAVANLARVLEVLPKKGVSE